MIQRMRIYQSRHNIRLIRYAFGPPTEGGVGGGRLLRILTASFEKM